MAPELWREKPEFSTASDTYALGMVFYEILTRRIPWTAEMAKLEKGVAPLARVGGWVCDGRRPEFEDVKGVDTVLAEIMVSCWRQQPSDRPSLAGILDKLRAECPSARAARAAEAERQRKIREAEERKVAEAKVRCITQCCCCMPSFLPPPSTIQPLSVPKCKIFFQAAEAERQPKMREAEERKVNTDAFAAFPARIFNTSNFLPRLKTLFLFCFQATNSGRVRMQILGQSYNGSAEAFLLDGRYCGDVDSEVTALFTFSFQPAPDYDGLSCRTAPMASACSLFLRM